MYVCKNPNINLYVKSKDNINNRKDKMKTCYANSFCSRMNFIKASVDVKFSNFKLENAPEYSKNLLRKWNGKLWRKLNDVIYRPIKRK